jgi:hypothetical protein
VAENTVGRNQPIKHSIAPEHLLTLRFHWFIPAHKDFHYIGRDVILDLFYFYSSLWAAATTCQCVASHLKLKIEIAVMQVRNTRVILQSKQNLKITTDNVPEEVSVDDRSEKYLMLKEEVRSADRGECLPRSEDAQHCM